MTTAQRVKMMGELWPAACTAQGWKKSDTARRYEIFARILGHKPRHAATLAEGGHISFTAFDEDDFTDVKKQLILLAGNLPRPGHSNRKKQLLWIVEQRLKRQIALYHPNPDAYILEILRERFKKYRGISTMNDLSEDPASGKKFSPLQQFIFTLTARVDVMRSDAGDSIHMMNLKAGTRCKKTCQDCLQPMTVAEPDPADEYLEQIEPAHATEMALAGAENEGDPF